MGNNPVGDLVAWLGSLVIFAVFGVMAYRIGKFTLIPGEPRRLARTFGLLIVVGGAIFLILPPLSRLFGSATELVFSLVSLGGIAVLVLSRRWVAAVMARRSPTEQTEFARRNAFFRSRRGRLLTVAAAIGVLVWILATAFLRASP
jgi:hypothetical protein